MCFECTPGQGSTSQLRNCQQHLWISCKPSLELLQRGKSSVNQWQLWLPGSDECKSMFEPMPVNFLVCGLSVHDFGLWGISGQMLASRIRCAMFSQHLGRQLLLHLLRKHQLRLSSLQAPGLATGS